LGLYEVMWLPWFMPATNRKTRFLGAPGLHLTTMSGV
jgi:hypothetical protein